MTGLSNKILIVFLDGVGLGNDSEANPFSGHALPFLSELLDGRKPFLANAGYNNNRVTLLGLDASLGVPGLPQSGTGQTAILTGLNAPKSLGKHDGPYPNKHLQALLAEYNLFSHLKEDGFPVAYAGAYPDGFHSRLERGKARLSANTRAAHIAGLKLRGINDLKVGRAISGMLTNHFWREWGHEDIPLLTPHEAGTSLVNLADDYALTYFEFWRTDTVGHKQDMAEAQQLLTMLDGFFAGMVTSMDWETTHLFIISDHGNFEDLSVKTHTLNPAMTIIIGREHMQIAPHLQSTMDISRVVQNLFR